MAIFNATKCVLTFNLHIQVLTFSTVPSILWTIDPYSSFATPTEYQAIPARFPSPHGAAPTQEGTDYGRQGNGLGTTGEAWIGAFQGLSMNTR